MDHTVEGVQMFIQRLKHLFAGFTECMVDQKELDRKIIVNPFAHWPVEVIDRYSPRGKIFQRGEAYKSLLHHEDPQQAIIHP